MRTDHRIYGTGLRSKPRPTRMFLHRRFTARFIAGLNRRSRRKLLNELDARTMLRDLGASPEHQEIGTLLRDSAAPREDLEARTLRAMEQDGIFPPSLPSRPSVQNIQEQKEQAKGAKERPFTVLGCVDGGEGGVP